MAILLSTQSYVQLYILYHKKPVRATNSALETRKSLKIYSDGQILKQQVEFVRRLVSTLSIFLFPKKSDW
jgi:hypothetical protein